MKLMAALLPALFTALLCVQSRAQGVSTAPAEIELDAALTQVRATPEGERALYEAAKEAYLNQGKPGKALSLLATYYKSGGTDFLLLDELAARYKAAGALTEAVRVREKLLASAQGENARTNRFLLLDLYAEAGDYDKAKALASEAPGGAPRDPARLRKLAALQLQSGDWGAEATLKTLIADKPDCGDFASLADFYRDRKRHDDAVRLLEESQPRQPALEVCLGLLLSNAYLVKGDKTMAEAALRAVQWKQAAPELKERVSNALKALELQPAPLQPPPTNYLTPEPPPARPGQSARPPGRPGGAR